jgi:acyl carrier protein
MDNRIKEIMAAVFETDVSMIDDNASPETIENWDSLKHMNLIAALEDEFNITFSDDDILDMLNYKFILKIIKKYSFNGLCF